ncbi:3-beta hydroxysteroid dehydrogenase/isomerase family protein-like protein [Lophiotrema nucula]|uniref:3-beta hydroxysteroid dehydrogenase/isomerase family protein-like protein n=1 Tax=Lophiotrema nucula TaxID=690887 RepID=A0A6A5Z6Y7_9PLEO|nr:3-beta hydroxysteroid dehydrogenase/isomerase family protein-like protein [Lophiotrema nucula]
MPPHRVLLTGANGFVASHILSQLLSASHSVRAIIRSPAKAAAVKALFPTYSKHLDFAVVPDMTATGAFDDALKSEPPFDVVMHTASPFLYKAVGDVNGFLDPAIKGTTEVLEGINRVAPSVKRVILTSSFAAIGAFGLKDETGKVYTESDWNPVTLDLVKEKGDMGLAYRASKTFAEKAAWEIARKEGRGWELVVLNPPMVYGPLQHKVESTDELNESTARIWNLFLKEKSPDGELPPNGLPLYVDVRDLAQAHLLAMDAPGAGGNRFIISAGAVSSQQISDVLRREVEGAEERVPRGVPGKEGLAEGQFIADSSRARSVLGVRFRGVEETFRDLGVQLLGIERGM